MTSSPPPAQAPRYEPLVKIAAGGMATVFVGALRGALGFQQLVAIKRPHEHIADDPELREALLAEARIASRFHHANVVDIRDVEVSGGGIQLIMDYVEGASLSQLITAAVKGRAPLPAAAVVRVLLDACAGLDAVHELADDAGRPLGLVHRDVSPQNILVGLDGVARVTDFGIVKEAHGARAPTTQGTLKGKLGYMAPEYVRGQRIDRRADVFALGVVLWEALAQRRLFRSSNEAEALDRILHEAPPPASAHAPGAAALDAIVERALAKDPAARFQTARELAAALEEAARPAGLAGGHAEVAALVRQAAGEELEERRRLVRERLAATSAAGPRAAAAPIEVTAPRVEATAARMEATARVEATAPQIAATAPPPEQATTPPRVRRARPWIAAVVLGAVTVVVALALALLRAPDAPAPVATPAPPAPPAPPARDKSAPTPVTAAAPSPDPPAAPSTGAPAPSPSASVQPAPIPSSRGARSTPAPQQPASATRRAPKPLPPNPYGP